jgi:hypothetical protein
VTIPRTRQGCLGNITEYDSFGSHDVRSALDEHVVNIYTARVTYLCDKCFSGQIYTYPPSSEDAYLVLLLPIVSAIFRRYCSIEKPSTASKITPYFLCVV